MRWFRFYDDVVNDPKVQKLSGDDFKSWINILCLASKNGGVIPPLEDLEFALRLPSHVVTSLSHTLKTIGLIDEKYGHMVPHNWDKRQFKSDTSADRMRRHRDRKRDVTVTGPEQITETEQNREEKEDTSVSSQKKGCRLPEDWLPSAEERKFARDQGLSLSQIENEVSKFKDYWAAIPGAKGTKLNWPATFRNWIRNSRSGAPKQVTSGFFG